MLCAECETAAATLGLLSTALSGRSRHAWAGCGESRIHYMMLTFVQLSLGWLGVGGNEFGGLGQKSEASQGRAQHCPWRI